MCVWWPVANKLCHGGRQSHAKIVCDWFPVAFKLYQSGRQSHANCTWVAARCRPIPIDFINFACDWWPYEQFVCDWLPVACYFCMRLEASTVKRCQFFKARCKNNYLNLKMRKAFKKLRTHVTHVLARAYSSTLCMARSNKSVENA
jgi:hypothetical protein